MGRSEISWRPTTVNDLIAEIRQEVGWDGGTPGWFVKITPGSSLHHGPKSHHRRSAIKGSPSLLLTIYLFCHCHREKITLHSNYSTKPGQSLEKQNAGRGIRKDTFEKTL